MDTLGETKTQNDESGNRIYDAIWNEDIEHLSEIFDKNPGSVNRPIQNTSLFQRNVTPLHLAAFWGIEDAVKLLIELSADVNSIKGSAGGSALKVAAREGQMEVVQMLLEANSDVNLKDQRGCTALHEAAAHGRVEILDLLLEVDADIHAKDDCGRTPLSQAAALGRIDITKVLVTTQRHKPFKRSFEYERDLDENGLMYYFGTQKYRFPFKNPVFTNSVTLSCSSDIISLSDLSSILFRDLRQPSVPPDCCRIFNQVTNLRDSVPTTPTPMVWVQFQLRQYKIRPSAYTLRRCYQAKHPVLCDWSFEGSVDGKEWKTLKVHENDTSLLQGDDPQSRTWRLPDMTDYFDYFRISTSASSESQNICLSFFEIYGDIDMPIENELHNAVRSGYADAVNVLLEANMDVNAVDEDGWTPLHLAVQTDSKLQIAQRLLDWKANINAKDDANSSVLLTACVSRSCDIMMLLLNNGADIGPPNKLGQSVLDGASIIAQERNSTILNHIKKYCTVCPTECLHIANETLHFVQPISLGNFGEMFRAELLVRDEGHKVFMQKAIQDPFSPYLRLESDPAILRSPVFLNVICKVPVFGPYQDQWYELQMLQKLPSHSNVIGMIGLCYNFTFQSQTTVALVTPLKEGGNLRNYVENNSTLALSDILNFAKQMLSGVQHLHENGFCHNNISLQSFVLSVRQEEFDEEVGSFTPSGIPQRVMLSQHALARPLEEDDTHVQLFPWRWSAPETIQSKGHITDDKSDVWMLGITYWELACPNFQPFSWVNSPTELMDELFVTDIEDFPRDEDTPAPVFSHPVHWQKFRKNCPERWKQLCGSCCCLDPEERPSCEMVLEMINAVTKSESGPNFVGSPISEIDFRRLPSDGSRSVISEDFKTMPDLSELAHTQSLNFSTRYPNMPSLKECISLPSPTFGHPIPDRADSPGFEHYFRVPVTQNGSSDDTDHEHELKDENSMLLSRIDRLKEEIFNLKRQMNKQKKKYRHERRGYLQEIKMLKADSQQ